MRYLLPLLVTLLSCRRIDGFFLGVDTRARPASLRSISFSLLHQHSSENNYYEKNSDDETDLFMAELQERMKEVNNSHLPLVVIDSILPRQVLEWTVKKDPVLLEMVRTRLQAETPSFGVVGRTQSGKIFPNGVEVEIVSAHITEGGLQLKLQGGRIFRMTSVDQAAQGWKQSRVEYVDLEKEESSEDVFQMAISLQRAREFTEPNVSMNEDKSLVEMWIELARTKELVPGQIDNLMRDLGPMPSWKHPSECALWVGALINPEPSLGVAWEIRPKLLLAKTADERTQIALDGIWNSIQSMEAADKRFRQIKE